MKHSVSLSTTLKRKQWARNRLTTIIYNIQNGVNMLKKTVVDNLRLVLSFPFKGHRKVTPVIQLKQSIR